MINEFIEQVTEPTGISRNFRFLRASDFQVRAPKWLINGIIEADSLVQFFGDPGSYKSFLGIDIAASVATGALFHGRQTTQGAALIIAGEGRGGLSRRIKAWAITHHANIAEYPLYISNGPAALCDLAAVTAIGDAIQEVAAQQPVSVVVIDTLARNFGPGDENSTRDMGIVISALDSIRIQYGCTIILVHHSGHGDKTRGRGAMALKGALDVEYKMEKDEQGTVRMEATKMKDAEFPPPMAFNLATVELGEFDGDMITSAVLSETQYTAKSMKTGSTESAFMDVIRTMADGGHGVDEGKIRDILKSGGQYSRQQIYSTLKRMAKKGMIVRSGGYLSTNKESGVLL